MSVRVANKFKLLLTKHFLILSALSMTTLPDITDIALYATNFAIRQTKRKTLSQEGDHVPASEIITEIFEEWLQHHLPLKKSPPNPYPGLNTSRAERGSKQPLNKSKKPGSPLRGEVGCVGEPYGTEK